ncbi:MAG TPA: hypothetical protein VJV76_08420 [Gaiellaceae bacterium]|nr:hypothetical protein [Gaiellaceae bacterium]
MRRLRVTVLLLAPALLFLFAQPGAAKQQSNRVKQTAKPIMGLAMSGSRVAYMTTDRRVAVWNLATGKTTVVKGTYPRQGSRFGNGFGTGEVAIAGKRVALITRYVTGNSQQTQEHLFTATLGGSAHALGKLTNHYTNPPDGEPDGGLSSGTWISGVVGSGTTLAVSTWSSQGSIASHQRLSLVTPHGLHTIATGPGAIVSRAANDGHIAVFRSTVAWPAQYVSPATATPTVGIYSSKGSLLAEVAVDPDAREIALSGKELVALTETIPQSGTLVATLQVYDWTTGALMHAWPVNLGRPGGNGLTVQGRFAALEAPGSLRLVDLTTGKAVAIAPSSGARPALGSRGLVYAVNQNKGPDKIVFVPTAKLLAHLG